MAHIINVAIAVVKSRQYYLHLPLLFICIYSPMLLTDSLDLSECKSQADSVKCQMRLWKFKKDKLKDSVIVIKNCFEYKGNIYTSEIKHKMFADYKITYNFNNGQKWMQFTVVQFRDYDFMNMKIIEPVLEWDRNGKLINSGIKNVSVSNDTFRFYGGSCYGLCPKNALSGLISGRIILNLDSSLIVKTYSRVTIDIDDTLKQTVSNVTYWVKYPDISEWKIWSNFRSGNYFAPSSYHITMGKYYNKPVHIYIQHNSRLRSNCLPDVDTKPMLTVIQYHDIVQ